MLTNTTHEFVLLLCINTSTNTTYKNYMQSNEHITGGFLPILAQHGLLTVHAAQSNRPLTLALNGDETWNVYSDT